MFNIYIMSRKVTTEDIKKRIISIHGDKYILDRVIYTHNKNKITLVCKEHGVFDILVGNLIVNKRGCSKCGTERAKRSCLSNTDDFILKSNIKHNNKYNYSKSIYVNWKTPLIILCDIHGEYTKTPNEHLSGGGCIKCNSEKRHKITYESRFISKMESENNKLLKLKNKQNKFIKEVEELHQKKYSYSMVGYISVNKKVNIICRKHGVFEQTPHHHKNGQGCPECSYENSIGRFKMNRGDFISISNNKHNGYYIYDKSVYNGGNKKVIITCPKHGDFEQLPYYHTIGGGCKHCSTGGNGNKNSGKNKGNFKYTNSEFIDECNKVHDGLFDYSETIFNGVKENIEVLCVKHGNFEINAFNHKNGQGCQICSMDNKSITKVEFLIKASYIHNNKYTYIIDDDIVKSLNKVRIICKEHGEFEQMVDSHIRGSGCSLCKTKSRGEISIKRFLDDNKIEYIRERTFNKMRNLRYDFYLPINNMCIEYDGKHHYEPIEYFGGVSTFEKVKKNDILKNEYCIDNNIQLLRISYKDLKKIDSILKNNLLYDKLQT